MTGVNRLTISRLALRLGTGAQRLHDRIVRDLTCAQILADEQWSYVKKKQRRVAKGDPPEYGDTYTFMAVDKATRLIVAWLVGRRDDDHTSRFIADVRSRLLVMPSFTTDGFPSYIPAIGEHFANACDYAQTIKNYDAPPDQPFIVKKAVFGAPDLATASTAYAERINGTMRHFIARMHRRTYAFSKKIEHHRAAAALAYTRFNFCFVVKTLRVTPAMAAGLTDHVWEIDEFFDALMREPEGQKPVSKPLSYLVEPGTSHRPLPEGMGFLRVVPTRGVDRQKPGSPSEASSGSDAEKEPDDSA